jgi:hypothetical protein
MRYQNIITMGLVCAISAGAAFLIGAKKPAKTTQPADPVAEMLNLSGDQSNGIQKDDPKFEEEMKTMSENLEAQRHKLLELLQSTDAKAEAINAQLEKTLQADAAMERRVISHLLVMREHLNPAQSRQLMNMCDQCMCGKKNAMGMGMGMGMGNGRGPMYRGGN